MEWFTLLGMNAEVTGCGGTFATVCGREQRGHRVFRRLSAAAMVGEGDQSKKMGNWGKAVGEQAGAQMEHFATGLPVCPCHALPDAVSSLSGHLHSLLLQKCNKPCKNRPVSL